MKKRLTKEQREEAAKNALLQRVQDIYSGACGRLWDSEDSVTATELSTIVPAIRAVFGIDENLFLVRPWNLDKYETPWTAAEFLFKYGIRHDTKEAT